METQITIKLTIEEKEIIKKASEILSLGHSTFCRTFALEKAREIIKSHS